MDGERRCSVIASNFVEPCNALLGAFGKSLSLASWINVKTRTPSRSYVVLKSGRYGKQGIALNCCPFCGERIDAPFADSEIDESQVKER